MYDHAKALFTEIGAQGKRINRQNTPCIMVREYIYLITYAGGDWIELIDVYHFWMFVFTAVDGVCADVNVILSARDEKFQRIGS